MSYQEWSVIAGETPTATKWNILGDNDSDFDTRVTQLVSDKTMGSVAYGSLITFALATRLIWTTTLGGNPTLAVSGVRVNVPFVVRLVQGTGGGKSVTWWSGINWPGQEAPPLSTVEGEIDAFGFIPLTETTFDGYFLGFGLKPPAA